MLARVQRSPDVTTLSPILKQATPVEAVSGRGAVLVDAQGREYLDFTAGIGVTSTGHCHPKVVVAAEEQVARLIHGQYTTVMHHPLKRLVARLGEVLPAGLDSVFFVNSGSEAVEAALRLARQATGRPNVIAFHGGFHGRTMGAASLTTSGTKFRTGFAPLMGGVFISPFPAAIRLGMQVGVGSRDDDIGDAAGRLADAMRYLPVMWNPSADSVGGWVTRAGSGGS